MGHHSCCNKQKVRRGLWSPEEDEKLIKYISTYGHGCWSSVPKLAGYTSTILTSYFINSLGAHIPYARIYMIIINVENYCDYINEVLMKELEIFAISADRAMYAFTTQQTRKKKKIK